MLCALRCASLSVAFILSCGSLACMHALADSTVVTDDVGIGEGVGAAYWVAVRFGDDVHVEWSASQTIHYELRWQTEILEDGLSYSGAESEGSASSGNLTFVSEINGTYTLTLLNDADGLVYIHVIMTVVSDESRVDLRWSLLGAAIAAVSLVLVVLVFGKVLKKRKK